ncbi:MAG: hypothetical protein IT328_20210 [Caldilineaceae bacterium]|nr:hypothetical protein [Caldilineaceae bacterium]
MRILRTLVIVLVVMAGVALWATTVHLQDDGLPIQSLQSGPPAAETPAAEAPDEASREVATPEPTGVDIEPPHILTLSIAPKSVNTTASSQVLTVTVQITDDLSGLAHAVLRFVPAAGGTQFLNFILDTGSPHSGDKRNGVYEGVATLPKYAAHGRWQLDAIYAVDQAGNRCGSPDGGRGLAAQPECPLPDASLYFTNGEDDAPPAPSEGEAAREVALTPAPNAIYLPALKP